MARIATPANPLRTSTANGGPQTCTTPDCGVQVMYSVSDHRFVHIDTFKIRCAKVAK